MKYTCPMHPQIIADKAAFCPICGMSLELMLPVLEEDRELKNAVDAVQMLHREGLKVIMLSGDRQAAAVAVGQAVGIDETIAQILTQRKSEIVKNLQAKGHIVAAAGDGINDAPVSAQADVGIAMGTGADMAIKTAQITLVKGDLRGIAGARKVSVATVRNIRQNLWLAFLYNIMRQLQNPSFVGALKSRKTSQASFFDRAA